MTVLAWTGHAFAAALFLLSAAAQLNDPDPARWIATYVLAAVLAALAPLRRRRIQQASGALALLCGLWGAWILSGDLPPLDSGVLTADLEMKTEGIELWREGLGLMLIALYHGLVALGARRRSP